MGALHYKLNTQSSAPEAGRNNRPKHVDLIGIINKSLLLRIVGCLYYLYLCTIHILRLSFILPARYQHRDRSPLCNRNVRYMLPGHKISGIKRTGHTARM